MPSSVIPTPSRAGKARHCRTSSERPSIEPLFDVTHLKDFTYVSESKTSISRRAASEALTYLRKYF
jgi:hypothetical protein